MALDEDSHDSVESVQAKTQSKVCEWQPKRSFEENATFFGSNGSVPMILWPKDRALFNRLELIVQMFEANGEWPQRAPFLNPHLLHAEQQQQRRLMVSPSLMDAAALDIDMDGPYDQDNSNSESDFYSAVQQQAANGNGMLRFIFYFEGGYNFGVYHKIFYSYINIYLYLKLFIFYIICSNIHNMWQYKVVVNFY